VTARLAKEAVIARRVETMMVDSALHTKLHNLERGREAWAKAAGNLPEKGSNWLNSDAK
jgi:hypothetical protein